MQVTFSHPINCLAIAVGVLLSPFCVTAWGASQQYQLIASSDDRPAVAFRLPYSLGTHDGHARVVEGGITIDLSKPSGATGNFRVPIEALTSGDDERDCHMREALGLDYYQSTFPNEHVCGKDDRLPKVGKDSVKYPGIELKVESVRTLDESGAVRLDRETHIEVLGAWTIHGVSRPARLTLKVTPEGERLRIRGAAKFSLKAHAIEVKSAKILFVTISVEDEATVSFNLLLAPRK